MSAPVDVLAIFDDCIEKLNFHYRDTRSGDEMRSARAAVAELVSDVEPLIASLLSIIDADNCMTQQAIMVQRAAASLKRVKGVAE
jgi:hypothetical protein